VTSLSSRVSLAAPGNDRAAAYVAAVADFQKLWTDRPPQAADSRSTASRTVRPPLQVRTQPPHRLASAPAPRLGSERERPRVYEGRCGGRSASYRPRMRARPCAARGRKERRPDVFLKRRCRGRGPAPSRDPDEFG